MVWYVFSESIQRFLWGLKLKLRRSTYTIMVGDVPMGTVSTSTTKMPLTINPPCEITVKGPCRKLMQISVNGKDL